MLGLGEVARGTQTYTIRPPEEVSQYQLGGVVRGARGNGRPIIPALKTPGKSKSICHCTSGTHSGFSV